jgi:hypothetical protein
VPAGTHVADSGGEGTIFGMLEPLDYSSLRDPRPHRPAVYTVLSVILWTLEPSGAF